MHPSELIHPSDTMLLGLVHGEHVADGADRTHCSTCESCRVRLADLEEREQQIALLLESLDHPMPFATTAEPAPLRRATRRTVLVGAAALLVAVAAAAATLPGRLVPRWMTHWMSRPPAAPAARPPALVSNASGVAVPVPGGKLTIRIQRPQASGAIDIALVARADVMVRSVGGDLAFEVAEGRLVIDNRKPAERYEIEVPPGLASLVVTVGDRVAFRKENDLVEPRAGAVRYHILLHSKN